MVQSATVRAIPKSDGPRVTSVGKGRKVTVTGKLKGGNWFRVETPAGSGWVFGSALLRMILVGTAKGSTSIYGPLATPIAVLLWLYLLSIAVLIGAALNAAMDAIWPQNEPGQARLDLARRLRLDAMVARRAPRGPRAE